MKLIHSRKPWSGPNYILLYYKDKSLKQSSLVLLCLFLRSHCRIWNDLKVKILFGVTIFVVCDIAKKSFKFFNFKQLQRNKHFMKKNT